MAITEQARHELHQRLEGAIGKEPATTLMEHLPPVGWADVATRHDVEALAAAIRHDLEALAAATRHDLESVATKLELAELRTELYRGLNRQAGLIAVMLTVLFTALKLT